jgi:hypothetical protein
MAIEIEPEKKEGAGKESITLVFSILILIAVFGAYYYYSQMVLGQKKAEVATLSAEMASLGQENIKDKEAELTLAGKYIGDFKVLFENNPKASTFFGVFQKWAQPKITYSSFTFDLASRKISMTGKTKGFQNVMQQIAILDQEATVESYEISNVALAESGEVAFNLNLVVKPEVLK